MQNLEKLLKQTKKLPFDKRLEFTRENLADLLRRATPGYSSADPPLMTTRADKAGASRRNKQQIPQGVIQLLRDYLAQASQLPEDLAAESGNEVPGIVRLPGVCGGSAIIIRTRIPVWMLERMQQLGATDEEILANYPTLCPSDLRQARAYAIQFRDEIEREIAENEGG